MLNKNVIKIFSILLISLLLYTNCSKSSSNDSSYTSEEKASEPGSESGSSNSVVAKKDEPSSVKNKSEASKDSKESAKSFDNAILSQRKIIRNANVTIEVKNFDKSYAELKNIVKPYGFVENSNIQKNQYYANTKFTSGTITLRIDKDKFDNFINSLNGIGELISENITSDDVTDKFFDTESRLKLLKFESGRLEEYLKKINDPDTIFKTESRLTEIRHEIESLTGTLNKWNDLIKLSTIVVTMSEKPDTKPPENKPYLEKLTTTTYSTLTNFLTFIGTIILFIIIVLPYIILITVISLIVMLIYRKFLRRNTSNKN